MDEKHALQQKAFKDYWAKCAPYHAKFLQELRVVPDATQRLAARDRFLNTTQPFYDEYWAYLKSIGWRLGEKGSEA